jgi:outer membrane protein TolC
MYNQPFSQPPGMFGAQSAMAQMQSAPSLPAGNPSAREYFNYSMATLSNAAMPQAMMPQGISSLVPQYQFGGGIGYSGGVDIDWGGVAAAMDSAQAQADAAAADADGGKWRL